ncbi:hypothetical protein MUN84_00480 [Hymenobacter sp. 5516J-16]|uniref:glycerophosphodiester phosphodiesterase n=1 Tax=Hymenobacter sp. 5516J-16 TaxID=2932253 RepID=UPI001FD1D75E|nr:glycerophosphodiester phosphodiesterase family protein [Hymenobacter sp. 5516J-16]UOQ77252.1 hypothetical protein MUN84_00480 [Hymenobacter sp. 5516J-16]
MNSVLGVWAGAVLLRGAAVFLAAGPAWGQVPAASGPTSALLARRPPRAPVVIGHAGSGFFHPANALPPNSLRGLTRALQRGADGVEVDVRLSQDSIPVLYHDHTLDSMTDGTGCVSQTPATQLTRRRYQGGWLYDWRQQERLITFETLLTTLRGRQQGRSIFLTCTWMCTRRMPAPASARPVAAPWPGN